MAKPSGLQPEKLMEYVRFLSKEIGPRPATSVQERQAADYVIKSLRQLGIENIQEQSFFSQDSMGKALIPLTATAALAIPFAWLGGPGGRFLAGLTMLNNVSTIRDLMHVKAPFFQSLIAQGQSQNVIARMPPTGEVKRRVFLIGHLDSNKQRFLFPPTDQAWMKPLNTLSMLLGALAGVSLIVDGLKRKRGFSGWYWLLGAFLAGELLAFLNDEAQPHVEGANDNATAVSVLLGIAETLRKQPLQHTEVNLLFTGCEEVGCVGMENYLDQYHPPHQDSYWIDIEMVGTGSLCYITKHGVSYLSEYYPAPEMLTLADRVASKNPDLCVSGKEMLIIEEVASLARRGYNAICLAGYNAQGYLANWHRVSDTVENIEPDTLARAAHFTWEMIQEIDQTAKG